MLVALLGVVLRYKIVYSLPFIDQKKLLEGHSHFAFAGWITQVLMALMINWLSEKKSEDQFRKYRWLLYGNLLTAYGMLISFPIQGYAFFSILFSTLSILVSYGFAIVFWKDLNSITKKTLPHRWFKIALLGNVISSIGPFSLAFMMAGRNIHQNWYLASIYFFLHFQYNIWFFFAGMGLATQSLMTMGFAEKPLTRVFVLFALAALPTYLLSVLWWSIGIWAYMITIVAVICQLAGWGIMITLLKKHWNVLARSPSLLSRWLFVLAGTALSIKLLLQAGSVIPSLSKLAFGFRPIVIGYLHLVFLGIITIFILAYLLGNGLIPDQRTTRSGLFIFVGGIVLNEGILMIQGIADIQYYNISQANFFLFLVACLLFSGAAIIFFGQFFPIMIQITKKSTAVSDF